MIGVGVVVVIGVGVEVGIEVVVVNVGEEYVVCVSSLVSFAAVVLGLDSDVVVKVISSWTEVTVEDGDEFIVDVSFSPLTIIIIYTH